MSRPMLSDEKLDRPLFVRLTMTQREKVRKRAKKDGFRSEGEWVRTILAKALAVR